MNMNRKLIRLVWSFLVLASVSAKAGHSPLLPLPQEVHYENGFLPVGRLAITFAAKDTAEDRFAAEELQARLYAANHVRVAIRPTRPAGPCIVLNRTGHGADVPGDQESAGPDSREAYSISVTKAGVEIRGASAAGLFYGVQTLLQMVEENAGQPALPFAHIKDWPLFAYRGLMMDFSHGQLLRVPEIERQIDLLARFKANQYYFYSEVSIAWDGYEVVNPDARYTQAEVRHIIDYARQRHMDVVPCMELYGHMHDLFRTEKFADIGLPRYGDEFDPRNPRALEVIDDLFDQTTKLFGSPWIHVGFDEPWSLGKIGLTPGKDPFDTFVATLQHIADRAHDHGKRLMYWADIGNGASTLSNHPELLRKLPGGAIAAPWDYDVHSNYDEFVEPLATNGIATMVTPAVWNWNEIFPDYHHSFVNINGLVESGKKFQTLGILNTAWTDCAQTLYRESLPGLAFGAIAGWQSTAVNTNSFFSDYCALTYAPGAAPEIAAALEQLSTAEEMFEDIFGDTTQHSFWRDPLQPGWLGRLEKHADACRQARLLAENAQEHIARAMRITPGEPTLESLMMAAKLFDYLGMKSLYAVEWDGYFHELQKNPDQKLVTLYIGIQMNAQDHGMLADLTDTITGLREQYREAWLRESTPYRLGTALARWDAESRFWLETAERVKHLLRSHKKGEPFPSIDVIRAKE